MHILLDMSVAVDFCGPAQVEANHELPKRSHLTSVDHRLDPVRFPSAPANRRGSAGPKGIEKASLSNPALSSATSL